MAAAAQTPATGKVGDDHLRFPAGLQVAILISKSHYRISVGDVYVIGIGTTRIKSNTERQIQTAGKDLTRLHFSFSVAPPQHANAIRPMLRDKQVTIRGRDYDARISESTRDLLHLKSRGHLRPRI